MSEEKPKKIKKEELKERYKNLFMDVVNVIQKEKNAGIVYQVLVDILMQIESQIKNKCGDDCGSCPSCK